VIWPLLAGTSRLAIVIAAGALTLSLPGVFALIAFAMVAFGALTMWFVGRASWEPA